jgi:hypothetical protein
MGAVTMSVVSPSDEELESLEGRELDEALAEFRAIEGTSRHKRR